MKTYRQIYYRIAALLFMTATTGCVQERNVPSPQKSQIRIFDNKRYILPHDASKSAHLGTDEEIAFFRKSGVRDCRKGDVIWDREGTQTQIAQAIRLGDAQIHRRLAREGRIGCAHPIER